METNTQTFVVSSCEASSQLNNIRSPVERPFFVTFRPKPNTPEGEVELNINGAWVATVSGLGSTPSRVLKGTIRMQQDITKVPNSYEITRAGNFLVFIFRSLGTNDPVLGGAVFTYPFPDDLNIDWRGKLGWKPITKGVEATPNATPDEPWQRTPITIKVEKGAVSQLVVARAADYQGSLEIDSDINANPPFPSFLVGTLWFKPEMFNLGIDAWQLTVKKPGGYYLTFAPQFAVEQSLLGYAHLDTLNDTVPVPGNWYGNVDWVLDSQPLQPPESNKPITLSILQGVRDPVGTATVGQHVTDLPGLNEFFRRVQHTGIGTKINVHGWIHIDKPGFLFGDGTWAMEVHQASISPGNAMFAILTFYSSFLIRDTQPVVGQAVFHFLDDPQCKDPTTEWTGEYSWKSKVPTLTTIDSPEFEIISTNPPKNLPSTAEISLILPNVAISPREIVATFGDWSAVLPNDFAKFFIYTPYEFPINLLSPKIVAGALLYEPSLTGAQNRWKVETAYGDGQAVMTLHSTLLGPLLPLGFAIFNGKFPAGKWEGTLEWKKLVKDTADKPVEA